MLILRYLIGSSGAPDSWGDATDRIVSEDDRTLQTVPKSLQDPPPASDDLAATINDWIRANDLNGRTVYLMVHGYLFDPTPPSVQNPDSPFGSIYGFPPSVTHNLSWLPLVGECDDAGAARAESAIAFTYTTEASLFEWGNAGWSNRYQYAVFDLSPLAARVLASVLDHLGRQPIRLRILAHSLGTRTTSQALGLLRGRIPANLDRVVLLDGAEFCVDAQANLLGKGFDVINITNGRDTILALGADQLCHPIRRNGTLEARVIGRDGLCTHDQWLDLQFDRQALRDWLASGAAPTGVAYAIDPLPLEFSHPTARACHWTCYTNDPNRALVRDLLQSDAMTITALKQNGVPGGTDAPAFGRFQGVAVPVAPRTLRDRQETLRDAPPVADSSG